MIKIKSIAAGLYMAVAASSLIFSAPAYSVVIGYDWTGTVTSPGAASASIQSFMWCTLQRLSPSVCAGQWRG